MSQTKFEPGDIVEYTGTTRMDMRGSIGVVQGPGPNITYEGISISWINYTGRRYENDTRGRGVWRSENLTKLGHIEEEDGGDR